MKKLIAIACFAALSAVQAMAVDGRGVFQSTGHAGGMGLISDQNGVLLGALASSNPFTTTQFKAELFGGLSSDPNTWTVLAVANTFTFFNQGEVNGSTVAVTGGAGQTLHYVVRAFDTTSGATFDTATIKGQSAQASFTLTDDNISPLPTAQSINNWTSFQLVPEPSTVLLGLMGGAGLLLRRRRR